MFCKLNYISLSTSNDSHVLSSRSVPRTMKKDVIGIEVIVFLTFIGLCISGMSAWFEGMTDRDIQILQIETVNGVSTPSIVKESD